MNKICFKCKKSLPLTTEFFSLNKAKKDGFQGYCKECTKGFNNSYYKNNEIRRESIRRSNNTRYQRAMIYVCEYLKQHPCVDCGEQDIVVLDFDHVRGDKVDGICVMVSKGASISKIEEEITKCEVRYSNCHRRRTAKVFGHFRVTYAELV